ncbi:MAG: SRPBCC family protein [Proteobacteria bacterium]|nr:SRPBCC family protein [Pseudomonadota bacterium]
MTFYRPHSLVARITPPATLSRFLGPEENFAPTVWGQLVDFESWIKWMPGVDTIERQDEGSPGRGSTFLIKDIVGEHTCEISYWDPARRLDLVMSLRNKRLGYSFTLHNATDDRDTELRLGMEFEFHGLSSLLSVPLAAIEKRRAAVLLERFVTHMQYYCA